LFAVIGLFFYLMMFPKFWLYRDNLCYFIQFKLNSSQHGFRKYSSASGYHL
jgi:hypothetical protein